MGIQGLLPLLKSIMVPIHIKDLQGCCVAVDTYSWLHKGALSCSTELCKGLPTSRHIEYCMHRVNLLLHYGVKPILVFDGGLLPMKSEQENKRARTRKENLARAAEHELVGNSTAAYECYQKAVDISPSIAHELIQVLKQKNVCYVVAPYEADAQMTLLAISKQVDAVITEDSDLIPFGSPRIIFKMDKFGQGDEFRYSMLQQNKALSFAGFTKQMLLEMCILSGCDYLQSLTGMGLKRAHALIKKFKSYDKVIKHLRYSTTSVPPLYEESFRRAILTFQHQRVYDPITQDIVHLSDISDNVGDDLDFLGPLIPQHIAKGIAEGDIDPFTKMPFQGETISAALVLDRTYPLKDFKPGNERKKLDLPAQKNVLTKYFCFASLEAKRKFKAPRITLSPIVNSSLSPKERANEEASACEMNCSPTSLESENVGNSPARDNAVEDGFAIEVLEFSGTPSHPDIMAEETRSPEHILLQETRHSIHKPCLALQKGHEFKNVPDAIEGKTRMENRKIIVRSSYFQHKSTHENYLENKQEMISVKDAATDICKKETLESAFENYCFKDTSMKRKTSPNDSVQKENVKSKHTHASESTSNNGYYPPNIEKTYAEIKTENAKFGSNISHLDRYSDIAEKSMENFVSVISSFRCSSSGSRASGLRAPLKDVRNNCTKRSTISVDFNQFAYVPKNRKTASASQRS